MDPSDIQRPPASRISQSMWLHHRTWYGGISDCSAAAGLATHLLTLWPGPPPLPPAAAESKPRACSKCAQRKYPGRTRFDILPDLLSILLAFLNASIRFSLSQSLFTELLLFAICCHSFTSVYLVIWFWVLRENGMLMYHGRETYWNETLSLPVRAPTQPPRHGPTINCFPELLCLP